jgi:dGTPase
MSAEFDVNPVLYGVRDADHGGRAHTEPPDPLRTPFELDRHRIVESTAFRRLEHKTQVFAAAHHDHFRTRLTHTLEVAQIARILARGLRVNETLAEAIALAHDLGHPPFGHAGEVALREAMAAHGGFNHNTHSLRVVEDLEHPFPQFRGLNLTAATRAGLAAHQTRYDLPEHGPRDTATAASGPSVEAQVASIADRIACACHDLEDAIGADFLSAEDLNVLTLWDEALTSLPIDAAAMHIHAIRRPVLDRVLDGALSSVVTVSSENLAKYDSARAVRAATDPLVTLAPEMDHHLIQLEDFLLHRVYRHEEIAEMDEKGRRMVLCLFETYGDDPSRLPQRYARRIEDQGLHRVVCDYIAGMTDRYCRAVYQSLTGREI